MELTSTIAVRAITAFFTLFGAANFAFGQRNLGMASMGLGFFVYYGWQVISGGV